MFKGLRNKKSSPGRKHAQTFVEYTLMLGVIAGVFIAMSPMVKRASQGMVKVVADKVGAQENAEQTGGLDGWLVEDETVMQINSQVRHQDTLGTVGKVYDRGDYRTNHYSEVNGGFSESGFSPLFEGY